MKKILSAIAILSFIGVVTFPGKIVYKGAKKVGKGVVHVVTFGKK